MKRPKSFCWILLLSVLCNCAALAQVTTGTISGTVSDPTGAIVPGVTITIRNTETGISRTVTTDAAGRYVAPQLPLGNYEVTAEAAGFQTVVRSGMVLTVGREAVVNFALQVGATAERITVTGEAPLIETTTSSISGLVSATQMKELPLNARSYEQLAFLQPNVYYHQKAIGTTNTGYAPRISAAGMRSLYNAYVVDGVDVSDVTGHTPGSVAGQLMGVETLREFRVLTSSYPAQYGRAMGAIIDVVSRGGTNELHGTVFEFLRNDKVDARSFFDPEKPPFRRNQFGFVLGGPIVRDRAFFFGSYEALRERLTTTNLRFVPTEQAKQGILPDPGDPTKTRTIVVHPAVKPYLPLYPPPQKDIGGGLGTFRFPFTGSIDENFYTGRVDYQHSDNVSYFARYTFDDTDLIHHRDPSAVPPYAEGLVSRNQMLTLAETRLFSLQQINEFRLGFVRSTPKSRNVLTGPDPQIKFPGTIGQGVINFTAGLATVIGAQLASLGSQGRPFENYTGNTFQFVDNLSYSHRAHTLKMGIHLERFHDNVGNLTETGLYQFKSQYNFESLENLLQGIPRSFSGPLSPSPVGISGRQWLTGLFVQDDYRVRPNFTLNLGLRYEWVSNYANVHNRFIILNDLFGTPEPNRKHAWEGRACAGCVDPRFGFAWDIFSNARTVLKGGFGVYRTQLTRFQAFFPVPTGTRGGQDIAVDFPSFPDPRVPGEGSIIRISQTGTGDTGVNILPRIPSTPSALHWNLTIENQITPSMMVRLGYVGSRGYHLDGGSTVNTNKFEIRPDGSIFFPPGPAGRGLGRSRPDFGGVGYQAYDFNSYYNAFTVTVGRRMRQGLGFEASYAFSRSTDDTSIGKSHGALLSSEARLVDSRRHVHHGLSGYDMRHRFVGNFSYEVPTPVFQGAFARKVLAGWQLNGIVTLQAGTPTTPLIGFDRANSLGESPPSTQRTSLSPSLTGPVPICPCQLPASLGGGKQESPQRYFDPTVFVLPERGTYGNAGRNIIIGPGLVNFDFALVKNTAITERLNLQFRAEGFNLFNNVNWAMPTTRIFETSGAIASSAGAITSTNTTGRQFQFALKLLF